MEFLALGRRTLNLRSWKHAGTTMLLVWMLGSSARAAEQVISEDAVKAAYLYRFAAYVEWPQESVAGRPFVIAVMEAPGIARELRRLVPQHPINQQTAQVREVKRLQELSGAQIVFVGAGHSEFLRAVSAGNRPMLLVTDDEQALDQGSMLNFVTIDKRVRFEVSLSAAERAGLTISSELLSVAIRVHGGRRQSGDMCMGQCGIRQARRLLSHPVKNVLRSPIRSAVGFA
ncbi:MAG TPA: YfiR family protein [Steroidobacteraceae bacterium]